MAGLFVKQQRLWTQLDRKLSKKMNPWSFSLFKSTQNQNVKTTTYIQSSAAVRNDFLQTFCHCYATQKTARYNALIGKQVLVSRFCCIWKDPGWLCGPVSNLISKENLDGCWLEYWGLVFQCQKISKDTKLHTDRTNSQDPKYLLTLRWDYFVGKTF